MSKNQKTLFTLSIILNILLLGVTGGLIYQKNHMPLPWQAFIEKLNPETKALVQQNFDQGRAGVRPLLSSLMKEREQLVTIMNEEKFDQERFDSEVQNIQKIQKAINDKKAASIRDLMTKMPYAERVKLTDSMARFITWDRSVKKPANKAGPSERVP